MAGNEKRREKSVQRIKKAAVKLFATKGYAGTSVKDIAAEAGLSKGGLLHYFPAKRDLALSLFVSLHEALAKQEDMLISAKGTIRERIHWAIKYFFKWVKKSPHTFLYLFGSDIAKVTKDGKLPEVEFAPAGVMRRLIIEGQASGEVRAGDPDILLLSFRITVEVARDYAHGWMEEEQFDALVDEVAELVWRGIAARPPAGDGQDRTVLKRLKRGDGRIRKRNRQVA